MTKRVDFLKGRDDVRSVCEQVREASAEGCTGASFGVYGETVANGRVLDTPYVAVVVDRWGKTLFSSGVLVGEPDESGESDEPGETFHSRPVSEGDDGAAFVDGVIEAIKEACGDSVEMATVLAPCPRDPVFRLDA